MTNEATSTQGDNLVERFGSGGPYEATIGYSRAVRAGDWVLSSGCSSIADQKVEGVGDAYLQTKIACEVALKALKRADCGPEHVVKTSLLMTDRAFADDVGRAHREVFGDIRPVSIMIIVVGFVDPEMLVEVQMTAFAPQSDKAAA